MNNFFLVITLTLVISCNVIFKIWYLKKDAKLIFQIYLAGRHVFFFKSQKRAEAFQDLFKDMQVQWKRTVFFCCQSAEVM